MLGLSAETIAMINAVCNKDTAGPDWHEPAPFIDPPSEIDKRIGTWVDGWWSEAKHTPAHKQRIGGSIKAWAKILHTTDMHPDDWDALIHAYTEMPAFNAAHFGIGLTPEQGVVQFASVFRNANHAGGAHAGSYRVVKNGQASLEHPNLATVGIEVMNAGGIRKVDGVWRYGEGHPFVPHGRAFTDAEVIPDPQRPGFGWHKPTQYQLDTLDTLCSALEIVLAPMPSDDVTIISPYEKPPTWALAKSARCAGHVTSNALDRSDPWPFLMAHINK